MPSATATDAVEGAGGQVHPEQMEPVLLDGLDAPLEAQAGRSMALLESLEVGRRVLHLNTLVPWFLFPRLETRGIHYEIQSREDGAVRILMWRNWEPAGLPREPRVEFVRAL